jgi:splicing factor U2AF subunit
MTQWDVPPPGFENMTAEQVKMTGAFPLPGQGLMRNVMPFGFNDASTVILPGGMKVSQGAAGPVALNATIQRQQKRLYFGNLPYGVSEQEIIDYVARTMKDLGISTVKDPVATVQMHNDKDYAFVEFKTPEEATAAMAFDGLTYQGQTLKVRRPKDYIPPSEAYDPSAYIPGIATTTVPETPNRLYIGNLPDYLDGEQVNELLSSFGSIKAFELMMDKETGESKGYAFCEYEDNEITELAEQGLNDMELGDNKLVVKRTSEIQRDSAASLVPYTSYLSGPVVPSNLLPRADQVSKPTAIMQMMNMVTAEELTEDQEYEGTFCIGG